MNYQELQQIAKEVGAVIDVLMLGRHDNTVFTTRELECFAAAIEKRTIERCAAVCETPGIGAKFQGDVYAAAIRKLGEQ